LRGKYRKIRRKLKERFGQEIIAGFLTGTWKLLYF